MTIASPEQPHDYPGRDRDCEEALKSTFEHLRDRFEKLATWIGRDPATELLRGVADPTGEAFGASEVKPIVEWADAAGWHPEESSRALRRMAARHYLRTTGADPADENVATVWRTLQ